MSLVKNISGGPLDVPFLGRIVEAGEIVEVPDDQGTPDSPLVWPANRWEPQNPAPAPGSEDDAS